MPRPYQGGCVPELEETAPARLSDAGAVEAVAAFHHGNDLLCGYIERQLAGLKKAPGDLNLTIAKRGAKLTIRLEPIYFGKG